MALNTCIKLGDGFNVVFDLSKGIDLSDSYYKKPDIVSVFGLPQESKKILYSTDNTPVNVDKLTICAHNNRTHTESTRHIYSNGLNISDIVDNHDNISFYGCIIISVKPRFIYQINTKNDKYECGVNIDKYNDLIITKSMIETKINNIIDMNNKALSSFFKQCIFIRVECDKNIKNTNCPFLSNDAMQYLHNNFTNVFGINLCSVDRFESPKVPNHRIWFGHNPKSNRLIVEGLLIPNNIYDGIYCLNLQLAPIANTDAVPTRPIVYKCSIRKSSKL